MDYVFTPLPAAHPMKWRELLSPVQEAVRNLLVLIDGAEKSIKLLNASHSKKELGNCFLVCGSRGTGKTTVLLSAQEAIKNYKDFFEKQSAVVDRDGFQEKASDSARELERIGIEWLDVLDLEPLPEEANLLATLLTRVRNALGSDDNAQTSILEEDTESARQQLTRLIHDATFMWENIREKDTRSIASRQVAAAEIYAEFRPRFNNAMNALTKELGRKSGAHGESRSIVLPIDNIDRSTYHLEAIVKLAQLVSHHQLWLVMAGDRVEVETFLERAYWKELIHSRVGIDTRGKESAEGEDETLVMARRQAAATSKKLWPSSHRIEINFVAPEETLRFRPPDSDEKETIRELLSEVEIPCSGFNDKDKENDKDNIRLIDLLDISGKIPLESSEVKFLENDIKDSTSFREELKRFLNGFDGQVELLENNDKQSLVEALNKIISGSDFRKKVDSDKEIESKLKVETLNRRKNQLPEGIMPDLNQMILEDLFPEHIKKQPRIRETCLTRAAQHGLYLSARGVLDLWQLAYWVVNDREANGKAVNDNKDNKTSELDFAAEKIARTMLRNAISASTMLSAMGKCLQDKIIQRTEKGGTSLLFYEQTAILSKMYLHQLHCEFEDIYAIGDASLSQCRIKITINKIINVCFFLQKEKEDLQSINDKQHFTKSMLADFVAAWLSILHDAILMGYLRGKKENPSSVVKSKYFPDLHDAILMGYLRGKKENPSSVVKSTYFPDEEDPPFVEIRYSVCNVISDETASGEIDNSLNISVSEEVFGWPMPKWGIFWADEIFRQRWEKFLLMNKGILSGVRSYVEDKSLLLLATGWINCVIDTYLVIRRGVSAVDDLDNKVEEYYQQQTIIPLINKKPKVDKNNGTEELNGRGQAMLFKAVFFYETVLQDLQYQVGEGGSNDVLAIALKDWLERVLPVFIGYLYVPYDLSSKDGANKRNAQIKLIEDQIIKEPGAHNLIDFWRKNRLFILAEMEGTLPEPLFRQACSYRLT